MKHFNDGFSLNESKFMKFLRIQNLYEHQTFINDEKVDTKFSVLDYSSKPIWIPFECILIKLKM